MYNKVVCGWVGCCLNWELMMGGRGRYEDWEKYSEKRRGRERGERITLQTYGEWEGFSPVLQWTDGTGVSLETDATPFLCAHMERWTQVLKSFKITLKTETH